MPTLVAVWNHVRDVWETSQQALCGHSAVFSETWPSSGMTRNGAAYALPTWVPRTDGSASSLLPTPAAMNPNDGEALESWQARRERVRKTANNGNGFGTPLGIAVRLLPTPEAKLATSGPDYARAGREASGGDDLATSLARLLPTPRATERMQHNSRDAGMALSAQIMELLPTPRATDGTKGGPNQRGSSGDLMLPSAVMLLPTPQVTDGSGGPKRLREDGRTETDHGANLRDLFGGASTRPQSADGNASSDDQRQRLPSPEPVAGNDFHPDSLSGLWD